MVLALDREATPQEEAELQSHLATCAACAAEWRALQALEGVLAAADVLEPPPSLAPRTMYAVARHRQRRAGLSLLRTAVYALLGALALAATPALLIASILQDNPSLVSVLLSLWEVVIATLRAVVGALATVLRAALASPYGVVGLVWVLLAGLLLIAWFRLVAGSRSQGLGI